MAWSDNKLSFKRSLKAQNAQNGTRACLDFHNFPGKQDIRSLIGKGHKAIITHHQFLLFLRCPIWKCSLTVHRIAWYLINILTMFTVPWACLISCNAGCDLDVQRKRFGAIIIATLFKPILFCFSWATTWLKNWTRIWKKVTECISLLCLYHLPGLCSP